MELTLTTPSLLFSAVSLILLAYTNRFLAYAQVVRNLRASDSKLANIMTVKQIHNLKKRLYLTRSMQILGISSLLLSVISMFFIYIGWQLTAVYIFAAAILLLIASLIVSIKEILISVKALEFFLQDNTDK